MQEPDTSKADQASNFWGELSVQEFDAFGTMMEAQKIAFGPVAFQVARVARRLGIFEKLSEERCAPRSIASLATATGLSDYALEVLLRAAAAAGLVHCSGELYNLTAVGRLIQADPLTQVNMDFIHDICFKPLFRLEESITAGQPSGLGELGDWATIYEGLSHLPPGPQQSWLAYDHLYSDSAFPSAQAIVYASGFKALLDVGGNTGRWLRLCVKRDAQRRYGLFDLPSQISLARQNLAELPQAAQVVYHEGNILDRDCPLPEGYDVLWMSQFLDCFGPADVVAILGKAYKALAPGGRLFVLEVFCDNQDNEVADFVVNMSSPYFTCVANGKSGFHALKAFREFVDASGFSIAHVYEGLGLGHTLLDLRKRDA